MIMGKIFNMNDVLNASFGEASSMVRASFKKTVNIKQYETEVVECSANLNFDKPMNGIERMICSGILQAQLEYQAYIQLLSKGYVTETQFMERKKTLENSINILTNKGEELLGKPMDYLFDMIESAKTEG